MCSDIVAADLLDGLPGTRVSYETRPLAEVNDAIEEVLHGKAKARIVLEP